MNLSLKSKAKKSKMYDMCPIKFLEVSTSIHFYIVLFNDVEEKVGTIWFTCPQHRQDGCVGCGCTN